MSTRNPDRESGIGEEPGDETIERLQALDEEDRSDNSSNDDDFVAALNILPGNVPDIPVPGLIPQAPPVVDPAMANPTAQQLATIPMYDGTRGESYLNWLNLVENAKTAYQWDHKAIMQVAQLKGGPKVQEWLRGQQLQGAVFDCWKRANGQPEDRPMEPAMKLRFGPRYTNSTAVMAVSNLTQKGDESCAEFLDRVVVAVDQMHYNVTAEQKLTPGYIATRTNNIISLFGAGLRDSISKVVLAQPQVPGTVAEMLQAAEAVEVEQSKKVTPNNLSAFPVSVLEEEEEPLEEESGALESIQQDIADLCLAVSASIDMSRIRCYNCQRFGHFARACPAPRRQRPFPSRGRGNRSRRDTRMDRRRRPFGPSRATMAIEDHQDEPYDEDQEAHSVYEEEAGNN
jgi:hypothetical protein